MPVQFESASTFNGVAGSATTVTVPAPAGIVEGDLLLALIINTGVTGSWTQPSGWVELEDRQRLQDTDGPSITYAFKIATASEPGEYPWVFTAFAPGRKGLILRFSGSPGVDVDGNVNGALAGTVLCPDVVTTVADALVLRLSAGQSTGDVGTLSPPAGHTERAEVSGFNTAISAHTEDTVQAAAGATGTESIVKTGFTGTQKDIGITVVLAPAAPPPGAGPPGGFKGPFRILGRRWRALGTGA